jgi:hypothetical protein
MSSLDTNKTPITYVVLIRAWTTVVVEAESEDEAFRAAGEHISYGDFELDEMVIDAKPVNPAEINGHIASSEFHLRNFKKEPIKAQ